MDDAWRGSYYFIGYVAMFFFGLRFLVQWIVSEREKRSVVMPLFWKLSMAGNLTLWFHCIIQEHFPLCLLQALQAVLAWRNLDLLKPKEKQLSLRATLSFLTMAALLSGALFLLQGITFYQGNIPWLRSPHSMGSLTPHEVPLFIHVLGITGAIIFSLRFWVQWWHAEVNETSTLSKTFWRLSLLGAGLSIIYFAAMLDWVNLIGPVVAILPYTRNLLLIEEEENNRPLNEDTIFVFAGEKSADVYGSTIVAKLREKRPDLKLFGVGGHELELSGLDVIIPLDQFQVMGFSQVIKKLPRLIWNFFIIKREVLERRPGTLLLIDQPDFTMQLAKRLRKAGYRGKIVQFVAPTVWAWRKNRAEQMEKHFDLLLTLFPFEAAHFPNLNTVWTGHPIVEKITPSESDAKDAIAIFPGSRPEEVSRNLPIQLEAALKAQAQHPQLSIHISAASMNLRKEINHIIRDVQQLHHSDADVHIVAFADREQLMRRAKVAIAKSGTVTLELGLHLVPTVVTYELSRLNRFIATRVANIQVRYFCIVNILKQKQVFEELIIKKPTAIDLKNSLMKILNDPEHTARIRSELNDLAGYLRQGSSPSDIASDAILALNSK